jgi:hypothetical protein
MHDELEIHRVLARYCRTIDDGAFEAFDALVRSDVGWQFRRRAIEFS